MNFEKKSNKEIKKMTVKELEEYYASKRKYEYDMGKPIKGIELRKKIHRLCLNVVKLDRIFSKEKIKVVQDSRGHVEGPIIYACTHIGGNDIQRAFEAIDNHAYLFVADLGEMYRDVLGKVLYLNGAICLNSGNKEDRHIAKERAVELLNKGGDLLIFPEGAWNVTDNLPVMKLFKGTIDMAKETKATIVPVAEDFRNKTTLVSIGAPINYDKIKDMPTEEANKLLRDTLASLKWKLWEKYPMEKRENITDEEKENFAMNIVNILNFGEGYQLEDVYRTRYKDKNEPTEEEVFSFVKKMK